MKKPFLFFAIFWILASTCPAQSQQSPAITVLAATTANEPLPGVTIRVCSLDEDSHCVTTAATAVTDADGRAVLGPFSPGRYAVEGSSSGFLSNRVSPLVVSESGNLNLAEPPLLLTFNGVVECVLPVTK